MKKRIDFEAVTSEWKCPTCGATVDGITFDNLADGGTPICSGEGDPEHPNPDPDNMCEGDDMELVAVYYDDES